MGPGSVTAVSIVSSPCTHVLAARTVAALLPCSALQIAHPKSSARTKQIMHSRAWRMLDTYGLWLHHGRLRVQVREVLRRQNLQDSFVEQRRHWRVRGAPATPGTQRSARRGALGLKAFSCTVVPTNRLSRGPLPQPVVACDMNLGFELAHLVNLVCAWPGLTPRSCGPRWRGKAMSRAQITYCSSS